MGRSPTLRRARPGDGPALLALYERCFARYGGSRHGALHALSSDETLVAEQDGELVALGSWSNLVRRGGVGSQMRSWLSALLPEQRGMYATDDPDAPFRVEAPDGWVVIPTRGDRVFSALAVHPAHRRRGIGESLVLARLALARQAGVSKVFVHCVADSGSRDLYQGLGFTPLVTKRRHYPGGSGMTLLVMPLRDHGP